MAVSKKPDFFPTPTIIEKIVDSPKTPTISSAIVTKPFPTDSVSCKTNVNATNCCQRSKEDNDCDYDKLKI